MTSSLVHAFDLDDDGELDLFAEEVSGGQRQDLPPNSFSSLACECGLSTFFCYGCGISLTGETPPAGEQARVSSPQDVDGIGDMESALKFVREKMQSTSEDDKVAEVLRTLFRGRNQ
jgi:hypothetical protein